MTSHSSPTPTLARVAVVATIVSVFALAGCASTPAPAPTPVKTHSATPSPRPTSPAPVPNALTCEDLLPASVLDSTLGGTFTLISTYVPAAGSGAEEIAGDGGVACEWSESSGATVFVAAGEPGASVLESGRSEAARAGTQTDAFGPSLTAYQSGQGGTTFDVFSDAGAWVQTTSSLYASPSDVAPVIAQIMQALPSD